MTRTNHPDARVAAAAARRHGIITRAIAISCGMTDRMIASRLRDGRWEQLARGVYRIAAAPETPVQRVYAGVLTAAVGALASAGSALALVEVGPFPSQPHIVVPPTATGRTPGLRIRRSPITSSDRTVIGVVPATTPARSLLDVSPLVDDRALESNLDEVLSRRLASTSEILGVIRRAPVGHGRWGAPRLREALDPWLQGVRPGSPAEVRLVRRIREWGLPPPMLQHRVALPSGAAAYLDVAWPSQMVGLEYDGARFHGPRQEHAEVAREEALRGLGWWIGRVDRHDLAPSSTRVRDELRAQLGRRAA